jgi:hypothetical protein
MMFRMGLQQMYGPAAEKVRESIMPFLKSCPLAIRLPHGIFVSHSVPENVDKRPFDKSVFTRPLDTSDWLDRTGVFQLVWGRDYRGENTRAFADQMGATVLINGHEPCQEGFMAPNDAQVILDCCADKASYVVLATDRPWTHAEIMAQVQRLAAPG